MIGVGVSSSDTQHPGLGERINRILELPLTQQAEIVKLLVRYRIARKAPWFSIGPCPPGQTYCVRSTT